MKDKIDKKMLFLTALVIGAVPVLIAYFLVFILCFLWVGPIMTFQSMTDPMVLLVLGFWAIFRVHRNYDKLKKLIIETTDKFNDILRKYFESQRKS